MVRFHEADLVLFCQQMSKKPKTASGMINKQRPFAVATELIVAVVHTGIEVVRTMCDGMGVPGIARACTEWIPIAGGQW